MKYLPNTPPKFDPELAAISTIKSTCQLGGDGIPYFDITTKNPFHTEVTSSQRHILNGIPGF